MKDYLERMYKEQAELQDKITKIETKLNDKKFCEEIGRRKTDLLIAQYHAMRTYITILQIRIKTDKD